MDTLLWGGPNAESKFKDIVLGGSAGAVRRRTSWVREWRERIDDTTLFSASYHRNLTGIGERCRWSVATVRRQHDRQRQSLSNVGGQRVAGGNTAVGTISTAGLYTAPFAAATVTISAVFQSNQNDSGKAQVTVLAPHHFGVRTTSTLAELYDLNTGTTFTPRGNNYIWLAYLTDQNGNQVLTHSTFAVGLYDSARAESALAVMQASGYNIVTVILEGCCQNTIGNPAGGLSSAYIANVVDFLKRAKVHSIAVVIASSWLPAFGGFNEMLGPCYPEFDDINLSNLSSWVFHLFS